MARRIKWWRSIKKNFNDKEVAIVGVSCYMSNNDKSIELAKRIREVRPEIKLMCGGLDHH